MKQTKQLIALLETLRHNCAWTKEQTFESIIPYTLEEVYEVVDAIESQDYEALKDELGDLLLQIVFYTQIASEQGLFNFEDIAKVSREKQLRRNPLDNDKQTAEAVNEAWEATKTQERGSQASVLDNIATALPALTRSIKLQNRAALVGFDWPDIQPVFDKVQEEIKELEVEISEANEANIQEEYGDLLFAMSNLARHLNLDPETSLRLANQKFEKRFRRLEQEILSQNENINDLTLEELDKIWDRIKHLPQ